jgi:hypothetical protein
MKLTETQTEQVIKAFVDIMNYASYNDIKEMTGLPVSRCVEIYNLSKDILVDKHGIKTTVFEL